MSIPLFLSTRRGRWRRARSPSPRAWSRSASILGSRDRTRRVGASSPTPCATARGSRRPSDAAAEAPRCLAADTALPPWIVRFQQALPLLGAVGLGRVDRGHAVPRRRSAVAARSRPRRGDRGRGASPRAASRSARNGAASPRVRLAPDNPARWEGHVFVWREAGRDAYARVVGATLPPPLWEVRYATVRGRRRRARGGVERHDRWPRQRPAAAARASRSGARRASCRAESLGPRAAGRCASASGSIPASLTEVGAEERQRPGRADWTFTFAEPARRRRHGRRGARRRHRCRRRDRRVRPLRPRARARGSARSASATAARSPCAWYSRACWASPRSSRS